MPWPAEVSYEVYDGKDPAASSNPEESCNPWESCKPLRREESREVSSILRGEATEDTAVRVSEGWRLSLVARGVPDARASAERAEADGSDCPQPSPFRGGGRTEPLRPVGR
jgi:hypothetical protein